MVDHEKYTQESLFEYRGVPEVLWCFKEALLLGDMNTGLVTNSPVT